MNIQKKAVPFGTAFLYTLLMLNQENIQKDYTHFSSGYQLALNMDIQIYISNNEPVRLLNELLEGLNYTKLLSTYSVKGRKSTVPPIIMFKILVYAYMNRTFSSREIERLCQRDIHFIWLLNGYPAPSHLTINRFRKDRLINGVMEDLFDQLVERLYDLNEIQFKNLFIDGTKIEANANRYSFVWLTSVTKNEAKLQLKIEKLLQEINGMYLTQYSFDPKAPLISLDACLLYLRGKVNEQSLEFVYGKGKRKTVLQRQVESLEEYIEKQIRYIAYKETIGEHRSSCSKTDADATFMRMKEDHMKNGQLKPGYNVQIGVEAEYIVHVGIFSVATDVTTLIPFLTSMEARFSRKYERIIADAGYESEENYVYLKRNNQKVFIKPTNYEQAKTKKFKAQIGKRENMRYDETNDYYVCSAERKLQPIEVKQRESKTGYRREVTIYEGENCTHCPLRSKCTQAKEGRNKRIEVSKNMIPLREESLQNIQSEEGIILRRNRSIQVEGAFGVLKEDYGFRKFLTRGKIHVMVEMLLLCFGYNVQKLHHKIQKGRCGHQLHTEKVA